MCRNPSCGGEISFSSHVVFDCPVPCFVFQKAAVAPSASQPLTERVPCLESSWQEPEAPTSSGNADFPPSAQPYCFCTVGFSLFTLWVKPRPVGWRPGMEKNFSRILLGFGVAFFCFFFVLAQRGAGAGTGEWSRAGLLWGGWMVNGAGDVWGEFPLSFQNPCSLWCALGGSSQLCSFPLGSKPVCVCAGNQPEQELVPVCLQDWRAQGELLSSWRAVPGLLGRIWCWPWGSAWSRGKLRSHQLAAFGAQLGPHRAGSVCSRGLCAPQGELQVQYLLES